jgi:hypothetical protein
MKYALPTLKYFPGISLDGARKPGKPLYQDSVPAEIRKTPFPNVSSKRHSLGRHVRYFNFMCDIFFILQD